MAHRPAIPKETERQILVECGHRCAACGEPTPLERAHIISWSKTEDHSPENLVCLCANCHQRSHIEKWGMKTLQEYKRQPWVNRRYKIVDREPTTNIEVLIEIEYEKFGEPESAFLTSALSAIGQVSPRTVKIVGKKKRSSVKVIVQMPSLASKKVLDSFEQENSLFKELTYPLIISEIRQVKMYVGTIVGESTSREFRLAIAHEAVREQDIIAVDSELRRPDTNEPPEKIRVWAKIQRIERLNPLFPSEAGHELAATKTDPFDTILSLSREMVTAVCQVLGAEPLDGKSDGKLDHLRYPPQPASSAYRPDSSDIARVVLGELQEKQKRALDLATLSNRPEVDVLVDGHAIVTRHLAILAMTGAGKSVTARRIIEQLAQKNYPIVIFDPHGDYTGLSEVKGIRSRVKRYYAQFPVFEEDSETVAEIVNTLGYQLTDTMRSRFSDLFRAATAFIVKDPEEMKERVKWLAKLIGQPNISTFGVQSDMWLIANLAQAGELVLRNENDGNKTKLLELGWPGFDKYTKTDGRTLEGIKKRTYRAASALSRMEKTNQIVAQNAEPLPVDRKELVKYGQISIIALAGYTSDFQATIYSLIADSIFEARITRELQLPTLLLLEEAHNFAPARAVTPAEHRAINTTKQIAQEGRKFGVGLILVSQRPSRLDETTLSQANSFIIMRMVNPADQNFVRKVIETLGEDEARILPDLDVGEAILSGQLINFPVLVRIKKSESEGEREERDAFEELERIQNALRNKQK